MLYVVVFLRMDFSGVYEISANPYTWVSHVRLFKSEEAANRAAKLWIRSGAQHPEKPLRTFGDTTDVYIKAVKVE